MAMNKKELAEMEALRLERDMYRAMHISDPVEPDVHPPVNCYGDKFVCGWLARSYDTGAEKAAVNSVYHRTGDYAWDTNYKGSWSQRAPMLYSKRSAALLASRHHVSTAYAKKLALLDREIEKALKEEAEK